MSNNNSVYDAFEAAGYARDDLVDPARVDPAMLGEGEVIAGRAKYRAVRLNSHGIEAFEVGFGDVVETGKSEPFDTGVEYTDDVVQPINFAQEHGLLNDDLEDRDEVTFFWGGDVERDVTPFTPREAIRALGFWGHRGYVPKGTAEEMLAAFGETYEGPVKDDPDVEGEQIARAPFVASAMASAADEVESRQPDTGISGHDRRDRQRFYRNLDALREAYGVEE